MAYGRALFPDKSDTRLQYMLGCIAAQVPFDMGCVVAQTMVGAVEIAATHGMMHLGNDVWHEAESWLRECLVFDTAGARPRIVSGTPVNGAYPAIVYPFDTVGDRSGCLLLMARSGIDYAADTLRTLAPMVDIMRAMIENRYLTELQIATDSIAIATQAIARDSSPQNIVNVLRDHIFNQDVSGCVIGLYGGGSGNEYEADFEYIEIKGAWSRAFGSGFGSGMRYELANHSGIVRSLPDEGVYLDGQELAAHIARLDDFSRESFDATDAQAVMLLPLRTEAREIGLMAVINDVASAPGSQHIRTYQIMTEFLSLGTTVEELAEQHEAEQRGRAALLDSVTDGVILILPDKMSSVLTVNTQFIEMFDLNPNASHHVPLDELIDRMRIPEAVRRELRAAWQSLSSNTDIREGTFKMRGKNGVSGEVAWYSAPVYQNQYVFGRIVTFQDISAEQAAKRLRDDLLRRISHELRTPLTAIKGFAQFILEHDDLPDTPHEYTQMIFNSASHLDLIVGDIVQITHADTGKLPLNITSANLNDIVIEVIARLEMQIREKNQKAVMVLDDENLPPVIADFDRVTQILTNLIANALKYGPENGEIHVETQYVTEARNLPAGAPPDVVAPCALVSVVDQGEGLKRTDLDRVFNPFYRTDRVKAEKIEGSGLGLAVARSLVDLQRGKIWAQQATKRNPGGRFFFTLPTDHA